MVGNTVNFPKIGKGQATLRNPGTDVVPLNTSFTSVNVSMEDYNASEYSDIFLQTKINFDERRELAQVVGSSIGRRQDQIIIDASMQLQPVPRSPKRWSLQAQPRLQTST